MKIGTHNSPRNYWGRRTSAEHTTVFRNLLFLLLLLLLSASGLLAQNFPPASNCSSKDLDMVEMMLQADQMGTDYQSGKRRMKVTVTNRTGTDRKAFVVWGTLNRYDSYGKFKSQEPLFVCVDNVQRNSTVTLPGKDSLYYNDDETIVVTNIYTAWSSASVNENCETISADPSKIAPRCAVKQSLKVYTGVNARFRHLQGNCDNNGVGRVHARPFGGLGPYKVGIKNDKDEAVATSQDMINDADSAAYDLPPGIYKLTIQDGKNNSSVFTRIVDGPPPFANPDVAVNHPDCQLPKGLVKVLNRDKVAKYRLVQNGISLGNSIQEDQFPDVESGDYELIAERGVCRGQKKFTVLPRPFIPDLPDVAVTHPDCIVARGKLKVRNPQASVKYFLRQNEAVLDSAQADEFSEVNPGEYQVEAKGLRCGLRNKVVVNPKPPRPDKPKVDKLNPSCTAPKGLVRLLNRDNNATYQLIKNGLIQSLDSDEASVDSGTYSLVATRGVCNNSEVVTIDARPFIPELPDVAVTHPDCIAERGKLKVRNPQASVKYFLRQNEIVLDSASVDEFASVASGEYQVEAKGLHCGLRNKVVVNPKPPRPDKPKLEKENPTCATPKGLIRLLNRDINAAYQLIRNGVIAPFNNSQDSVEAGDYSMVATRGACNNSEIVTVDARPFIPELPDVAVTHPDCIAERGKLKVRNTQASVKYYLRQNETVLDSAAVDEFAAVASGEYQVEAKGLHCGLRNKVVVNPKPPRPDKPKVDKYNPSCTAPKGLVRLLNRDNNATYQLIKNGLVLPFDSDEASVDSGNYSLVATRGICTNDEWVLIAARPFIPKVVTTTVSQPNCTEATGKVSLAERQSNVKYVLLLNNEEKYNTDNTDFSGVVAGSYQLVAQHLQGQQCTTISPNPVIVDPQPLVPNAPVLAVTHPTCTQQNGYVTVSNKQSLVTYTIVKGSSTVATANANGVFTDIAPGDYKVVAQAAVCKGEAVTTINAQPKTPTKPQLEVTSPSFCNPKGSVKVISPTDAGLQFSKDNGQNWQSVNTFADLAAGSGSSLSFVVSLTTGDQTCTSPAATVTCAAPAALTEEVGGTSAGTGFTATSAEANTEESTSEKKDARYLGTGKLTEATVTIKPVPNPFQTTVRFLINSPEAGRAVLDIFNGQGQLIKTVYQGYVYEGASYYDLLLPRIQKNADLVYVFRIGNKVVTGKLIQLGNKF